MLTASYGLVNPNEKWQVVSDQARHDFGFSSVAVLPQLFYLNNNSGKVTPALVKVVYDFLICGETDVVDNTIRSISEVFTLGTIIHGPGLLRYFGLNVVQHDYYTITIDSDDKLNGITTAPITHVRRRHATDSLSPTDRKTFASINISVGWLGITASPFCAVFSSLFQQDAPTATISTVCIQAARLAKLLKLGTATRYARLDDSLYHAASIVVFCDAGRPAEAGQLCNIGGLLVDDFSCGSIFHVISWASHKAHRPERSTDAAETLAAGEGIDTGKIIVKVYKLLLQVKLDLVITVNSKDLYTTLTAQRQSVDRPIRGDVGVLRFEVDVKNVSKVAWIPGKLNPADIGTKLDSQLTLVIAQMLATGRIPFSTDRTISCSSDDSLG